MNLDQKSINLEIKAEDDDDRTFTAYASKFGNTDTHYDVVLSGAFAESLKSERKVKLLFNHNPNEVVGKFLEIYEDETGLFVKGRFSQTARGDEVRQLVMDGAIDSMSIGYRTKDYEYNADGHRLLKQVDLFEISFVTFPSNDQALVVSAKSSDEQADIRALLEARIALLKA